MKPNLGYTTGPINSPFQKTYWSQWFEINHLLAVLQLVYTAYIKQLNEKNLLKRTEINLIITE